MNPKLAFFTLMVIVGMAFAQAAENNNVQVSQDKINNPAVEHRFDNDEKTYVTRSELKDKIYGDDGLDGRIKKLSGKIGDMQKETDAISKQMAIIQVVGTGLGFVLGVVITHLIGKWMRSTNP
jgi:hypothetical protein